MPFFELADMPERIGHRVDRANDARRSKGYGVWKEWEMESEAGKIRLLSI